jgi:hypothetical protein
MTATAMTEPTALPVPGTPAPRLLGLRVLLFIMALFEAYDGLSNVSILFGDMSKIPGPGFGGFLIKAYIAGRPLLALAVLVFTVVGALRYAIISLAAIAFMTWLNYLPSAEGLELGDLSGFEAPMRMIAFPLMAACAIALAARNRRLGIATVLASIPTLFYLFFVIAFAVGVAIYGF